MKNSLIHFIVMLTCSGCIPAEFDLDEKSDEAYVGQMTTLVNYKLLEYDSTSIRFEISVNGYYWPTYEADGEIEFLDFKNSFPEPLNPTVLFLVDQSGSYETVDPQNARLSAMNYFTQHLSESNFSYEFGSFANDESSSTELIEYAKNEFNTELVDQLLLYNLALTTGGENFLYDALDSGLDNLIAQPDKEKRLVVMVRANDEGSSTDINDIIDKARANHIQIDIIVLDPSFSLDAFWTLTNATGGSFTICPFSVDLDSAFLTLLNLMEGITINDIVCQFNAYDKPVVSGKAYEIFFHFDSPEYFDPDNPVFVKIVIP